MISPTRPSPLRRGLAALGLLAAAGFGADARAASCTIPVPSAGGATLLDFGPYSRMSGTLDVIGTLSFTCTGSVLPVAYTLSANQGANSGTFSARRMAFAGSTVVYNIYTDITRAVIWGDGSGGTQVISGNCAVALPCIINVFGRMPGGQIGTPGPYSDALTVTVAF